MTRLLLTCSPFFTDAALNEVHRHHPHTVLLQSSNSDYLLLETPCSFNNFIRPWRNRLSIYLHHAFPLQRVLDLTNDVSDLYCIRSAAQTLMAEVPMTVQVRASFNCELPYTAYDVQRFVCGEVLRSETAPTGRVLSIVLTPQKAYLGVSWANQNLSPWTGGRIPVVEPVSNRAGYKLLEALEVFSIRLRRGGHALDLGAAPGAWTTLLRKRGLHVTAVAPTPLYPWLMFDSGVAYQPLLAETYLESCQTEFDLIVNDMKLDAQDSARLMVAYADRLRPEGIGLMTLKLRERNRLRVMDHALRLLRKRYKIIRVRQLVSNQKEVTLFLRRKPD